jgi:hypothetical protein
MKVHLELQSETLADLRDELEAFLTSGPARVAASARVSTLKVGLKPTMQGPKISRLSVAAPNVATNDAPAHNAADIVLGLAPGAPANKSAPLSAPAGSTRKSGSTRSAADIALGIDDSDDDDEADDEVEEPEGADIDPVDASPQTEAEALLAYKAQLQFDFDRVLALQGHAAAIGIVRGVMPRGSKTRLKDLEALPVELIPAAIEALRAAQAD